jgi:hypothetical protein
MATYLNYPFDSELFLYQWGQEKDLVTNAMLQSGAVVSDAVIANLISNGSDIYTAPFYKNFTADPVNYDGATKIDTVETEGSSETGVVFGRAKGFKAKDFIADFNSGADPMSFIVSKVAKYWQDQKQKELLAILNAIFGITSTSEGYAKTWATEHVTSLALSAKATVEDANKLGDATVAEAAQKALGENAGEFSLAIMHSKVALNLATKDLLQYRKYTDPMGIERTLNIADINGFTVVIDDRVPASLNTTTEAMEYTTFLLGTGCVRTADAPVDHPASVSRDEATDGGVETLWTRQRQTIHPNGFSFVKPSTGYTSSPTRVQLGATANWTLARNPKEIAMAKIVSNG